MTKKIFRCSIFFSNEEEKGLYLNHSLIHDFLSPFFFLYRNLNYFFFLEPYEVKFSHTFLGDFFYLSQWAIYRIVAIDARSRREGRDLGKVGFYDPIKKKTYLNVPVILFFLEKGAQPTKTVHDILRRTELFKERSLG